MEFINLLPPGEELAGEALIAAIDVGSNAMRLGIAARDAQGAPRMIQRYREPVRLGHDAFTSGIFSEQTIQDTLEAFRQFRRIIDQNHIELYRATATSAMRDAKNGRKLIRRIKDETGIEVNLISGEEEARLVHYSISRRVDLSCKCSLLIDMGGGSVEVTLCDDGEVVAAQSFKIGTVRLLEMLSEAGNFNTLLHEYLDSTRKKLRELIGRRHAELCVATGGNASAIGELGRQLLGTAASDQISFEELGELIRNLSNLSVEERIRDLGLRPDRADVILPAAMVFREIMRLGSAETMQMPDASLMDGVILDMVDSEERHFNSQRANLIAWTRSLKKKYHVDQRYANEVARLALELFDQTRALHGLAYRDRLLLEIAALVHEIGMYIRVGGHHRHAAYIISASPLLGLGSREKSVLAQTVRYHRKAFPSEDHRDFANLKTEDQQKVWHLSALLRLAIALNKERRGRVKGLRIVCSSDQMMLHIGGDGDLNLERWAAIHTTEYIAAAFDKALHIDLQLPSDTD